MRLVRVLVRQVQTRRLTIAVVIALVVLGSGAVPTRAADRAVAWLTSSDAVLERELNALAARGLRFAAVSDGLSCSVAVMQTPERPDGPAAYRVVADRDLVAGLDGIVADGFVPRGAMRRFGGGRVNVIVERAGKTPRESWRAIEFAEFGEIDALLAAAARDGYRARLLARPAFKSWPGLSERGLLLASKPEGGRARESRLLVGKDRNVTEVAQEMATAAAAGWNLDLLFTAPRDGIRDGRRERLGLAISRDPAETAKPLTVKLERETSFGIFGSGIPLGGAPFWDNYSYAYMPADRRQVWASPISLSKDEANCIGLDLKLRFDAPHDLVWSIVALLARPTPTGGTELVYITDQRLGF